MSGLFSKPESPEPLPEPVDEGAAATRAKEARRRVANYSDTNVTGGLGVPGSPTIATKTLLGA